MRNSAFGFRRFNRFNDGDFDRDDRFRRFHRFNDIIVFDDFGFPFFSIPSIPSVLITSHYRVRMGITTHTDTARIPLSGGYGVNGSLVVQVRRRLACNGLAVHSMATSRRVLVFN